MSILKVARMGHPVLRARAKAIDPSDIKSAPIQQLIEDMFQTMQEYNGVGLAAPQVHHSLRLFVAGFPPRPGDEDEDEDEEEDTNVPLMAIINPEITVIGEDVVEDWEGCLSIPDIRGRVPRAPASVMKIKPPSRAPAVRPSPPSWARGPRRRPE